MKQKVIEPVLGICLLAMVVMAVKYGSIRVTGSGDAYIKETPVVVVDAGHGTLFRNGQPEKDGGHEETV